MIKKDLEKEQLYEAVKAIIDSDKPHLHFSQQKLYTLFSIGFQYLLYKSTKSPGNYIIRVEDSYLAEKLARKSKDHVTRQFMQKIYLPRRFKYERSNFYLDFFNVGSWGLTNDLPEGSIKGALIVKSTHSAPLHTIINEEDGTELVINEGLPKDIWASSLASVADSTITIAFEEKFDYLEELRFNFIKEEKERAVSGVKISDDIDFSDLKE
ncbi:MAG: hypothetical protein ACI9QD_000424 [Thermoproteota archaeon]|jgi:hypothetical protein